MKFILWFSLLYIGNSFTIKNISPQTIPISFSKEKDIHETTLEVILDKHETNSHFMLFISDYNLKYNNDLLEDTWKYCYYENIITTDFRTLDKRKYSCCIQQDLEIEMNYENSEMNYENSEMNYENSEMSNQTWKYTCPVPFFPERDFLFDLFLDNRFPIYIKQFWENKTTLPWKDTGYTMNYLQEEKIYTFFHHLIVWVIFIWMIGCITYTIMTYVNKWSNQHEILFTLLHIVSTIFFIYIETIIYNHSESSFSKDIFLFSFLNTFYSIFLIYIPHHKNPEDPHSIEQRVPVEDVVFQFSLKIFKHPITKQICSIFYIFSFVYEIISIYFFADFLRTEYDFELEVLIFVSTLKFIFKLTFLISFLTAIYEVHIPVRINNETGQLLQILPESHYDRVLSSFIDNRKVKPKTKRSNTMIGLYDKGIEQTVPFQNNFQEGEIIAYQNVHLKYQGLLWSIGKIRKNKIELYDSSKKRKIYFLNMGYGHVFLPSEVNPDKNIIVYQYINKRFVRIGRIKNRYFFEDHHLLISVVSFVLNIIPDYLEEDYDVNVVEILRHTFHGFTNKIGEVYGYIYWSLFIVSLISSYLFVFIQNYNSITFKIFQIIILCVLAVFNINSSLYIQHDLQETVNVKKQTSQIHRGDNRNTKGNTFEISKTRWPELLNTEYKKAYNYFQKTFPYFEIECIPDNIGHINDFNGRRIIIFYDIETNLITTIPTIG